MIALDRRQALGVSVALLAALLSKTTSATPRLVLVVTQDTTPEELQRLPAWKELAAVGSSYATAKAPASDRVAQLHALLCGTDGVAQSLAELALRAGLTCPLIAAGPVEELNEIVPANLAAPRFSSQGLSRTSLRGGMPANPSFEAALRSMGRSSASVAASLALQGLIAKGIQDPGDGADKLVFTATLAADTLSQRLEAPLSVLVLQAPAEGRPQWFAGLNRGLAAFHAPGQGASVVIAGLPRALATDRELPRMALLFSGPAFKRLGVVRAGGSALDVAPTLAHALGLKLSATRGNVLRAVLA
ncbi:MAG: hypothetical protein EXS14_04805 [Planctomycetes bacterium]|nr:hypothetical protein [Planctomycetota bacterium]